MTLRRLLGFSAPRMLVVPLCGLIASGVSGCGSAGGGYQVRAIFDDADNAIVGENVKIAGVTVGSVSQLRVTPDQKAAVVLDITNPGFADFRSDASCTIRPQSLIGEVFVECSPTQPRPAGAAEPPPLPVIPSGQPGAGEHLLPVSNTSSPVSLDLIGDITRLPYSQRLSIIIDELGTGLAGNGAELAQVVQRADPTLSALDRVLALLASENHTLAQLASASDAAVAPLAADRVQVANWISQTDTVATVAAERSGALARTLAELPGFLRQLTPSLGRLAALSAQANPVLANLSAAAPSVNVATQHLAPLARGATSFLTSLGETAQQGTSAIEAARPVTARLASLGVTAAPFARDTAQLLTSVERQGGLQDLLDFIFRSALAANGYDSTAHYFRAFLVVENPCIFYQSEPFPSCDANFPAGSATTATTAPVEASRRSTPLAAPQGELASSGGSSNTLLSYLLGN